MKHIGNLTYAEGSRKAKKRIGRGAGSGHGGTATRGHKGHQSRANHKFKRGFEGGQMPLSRRVPKFGFTNIFRIEYQTVNLSRLQELVAENRLGAVITPETLYSAGAISKRLVPVKILGNGDITSAVTISAHGFSETAKQKIEKAGGTANIHG